MRKALVGYTGFVGQNIDTITFDALINSKNIADFQNEHYDLLIISAGDARKWYANQNPCLDMFHMLKLFNDIKSISAEKVIVFSTIDVYNELSPDNRKNEDSTDFSNAAYGMHRLMFEELIKNNYKDVSIIRLPGLFGKGLKKNVIYDLCFDRRDQLCNYNPLSSFQYFDLKNINQIIDYASENSIPLINLVSEPVSIKDVINKIGYSDKIFDQTAKIISYNISSIIKDNGYFYSKDEILNAIKEFYENEVNRI